MYMLSRVAYDSFENAVVVRFNLQTVTSRYINFCSTLFSPKYTQTVYLRMYRYMSMILSLFVNCNINLLTLIPA